MVNKINCACKDFEEISEFYSISEFERFQRYIEELVNDGSLVEVQVQKRFAGFPEQWYHCKGCMQTWRLVHPDFPFKGIWERVK